MLHSFVTFFTISDIFLMSDVTFGLEVFDINVDFVAWDSPPLHFLLGSGLWDALGVGATCKCIFFS